MVQNYVRTLNSSAESTETPHVNGGHSTNEEGMTANYEPQN